MQPLISVIVPNYQGKTIFPDCIKSLLAQDYKPLQIVFVDDSSTDGSLAHARKLYGKNKNITITHTSQNSGYVGACNQGLQVCKGKYVMVTNNDATFPKDWVSQMYRTVKGKKKVIGASFLVHDFEGDLFDRKFKQGWSGAATILFTSVWRKLTPLERKNDFVEGQNAGVLIMPRAALGKYIFYPDYFAYGEDIELCWRLRLQGYSIVANRLAKMRHYHSFTRRTVASFHKKATFHGTKNRVRNYFLFFNGKNTLKLLPAFFTMETLIFLLQPRAIPTRIKSYWWVLTHVRQIVRRRKEIQSARIVDDNELMRLLSYRVIDDQYATTPLKRRILRTANSFMRVYCKIFRIKTFDLDDHKKTPVVDEKAVA